MCESIGVEDFSFGLSLTQQYVGVVSAGVDADQVASHGNSYLSTMKSLRSQDEIEAMLLTQILSLQKLGMSCAARAARSDNPAIHIDRNINNLSKVLRLQHEAIETLGQYRRQESQYTVVQHVNVNDGGRAIVGGTMMAGGGKNGGGYPMMRLCGARTKSNGGLPCKRHPMANGRCYLHGGKSTGAKTVEGKLRQKMASWKHGFYSREAQENRRRFRSILDGKKDTLNSLISRYL